MSNVYRAYLSTKLEAGGSETTIHVDRMTNLLGETVTFSDFADFDRGILTVNPDGDGQASFPEYISFTGISSNTFTGAIRGLSGRSNTPSSSLIRFHPVGTPVTFSFGYHNLQDLVDYVDESVAATVVGSGNAATATAGNTISIGQLVYLKNDGKWWRADADEPETLWGVQLGIAQGAGAANNPITNGVLLRGRDSNQSGLVAGTTYYASNTSGGISSSPGTHSRIVGVGLSTTAILFDPYYELDQTKPGVIQMFGSSTPPNGYLNCDGSAISRTTYARLFAVIGTTFGIGNGSTTFNVPSASGRFLLGYSAAAPTKVFTFASRSSNVITVTGADNHAHNEIQTGQAVLYDTTSGVITGLSDNTTYYLIRVTATTFSLATSIANANAGTAISLSGDGSGTQTFTITYTARPMGQTGGEETHALTDAELPSHAHNHRTYGGSADNNPDLANDGGATDNGFAGTGFVGPTGSDTVHNNMPLSLVVNFIIKT